jgi:hypothetical protein
MSRSDEDGYGTPRFEGMSGMWPGFDDTELRWLRELHAKKFLQSRVLEQKYRAVQSDPKNVFRHVAKSKADDYKRKMAEHMRAVQALNDCFPIGDNVDLS